VSIENNEIHHIEGTAPQFGIDIESLNFTSRDIVIRGNRFHHNRGGDFVNADGRNVWFEDNHLDQTGLEGPQTDGPFVHWSNTDQVVRGNTFVVTTGSSNGRWAVIGYSPEGHVRKNPAANVFEDNHFVGGGLHMMNGSHYVVRRNVIDDWMILGLSLSCLRLDDNDVRNQGETYKFREVKGRASGNIANGKPIDLPMADDRALTNSPPHLW
jgi:mannuronan 5-epimerase